MNRAMFSGVAGLKTHQTKMDVIGNNIANVNTYGYKAQRAVFSDIFYQTIRDASAGTANRGGTNPSTVGYGSMLAGIQTQMTQSSLQSTGFGLDVAITGEGFFQVMDADGNIFYTKAGLFDYDSNGYLTDINGNFVLGATSADGTPGTQKISLDNVGAVEARKPTTIETINGITYTITASNATKYGNVSISISSSEDLPAGLKAAATITATGAIAVSLNAYEKFSSLTELNNAINAAITEANGGKQHTAGTFTITSSKNVFGRDAVNGGFTGAPNALQTTLSAADPEQFFGGALSIKGFKPGIGGTGLGAITSISATQPGLPDNQNYLISITIGSVTYEGEVSPAAVAGTVVKLTGDGAGTEGEITLSVEKTGSLLTSGLASGASISNLSLNIPLLGGATITGVSTTFPYAGDVSFSLGTINADGSYTLNATIGGVTYSADVPVGGGTVTLKTSNDADGTITMNIPSAANAAAALGIDIANLDEPFGLAATLGNHNYKTVDYKPAYTEPLTGAQIAGSNFGIIPGSIEGMTNPAFGGMTFLGTSSDFTGSGFVLGGDGFYAIYHSDPDGDYWEVTMEIGEKTYSAQIREDTLATSLLLKSAQGDYIKVSNPGFEAMSDNFGSIPADGDKMVAYIDGTILTVTPATASKDLGFSTKAFVLEGGTEGGVVTLDQLTNIAIGADGTISVNHAEKGTVVVGKISLASFANPAGLAPHGSNYFRATANSGDPKLCDPGSDGTGALKTSALEMSNVDLSSEFADMITTQRGFQANTRIITVSDTMLEELINLKR